MSETAQNIACFTRFVGAESAGLSINNKQKRSVLSLGQMIDSSTDKQPNYRIRRPIDLSKSKSKID